MGFNLNDLVWYLIIFIKNCDWLFNEVLMVKFLEFLLVVFEVMLLLSLEYILVDIILLRVWVFYSLLEWIDGMDDDLLLLLRSVLKLIFLVCCFLIKFIVL